MSYDAPQLLKMSQAQLDDLFRASPPGDIPNGSAAGHGDHRAGNAIFHGDRTDNQFLRLAGKGIRRAEGLLKNRILASAASRPIVARVYKGPSWLDGKECIVLDYSETSMVAQWVRDEIRLIGPDFYLGKVYWSKDRLIDFCLQF